MYKKAKIGVVCLARETFDFNAAKAIYDQQKSRLRKDGTCQWEIVEDLVITVEDAKSAAITLSACQVDGLVIISGTFHLGHLVLILDQAVQRPILLWAFNELPYDGGKIRLNSVCGINLNASNLYKAGNDCFTCTVGDEIDQTWLQAIKIKSMLRNAHVGLVGYRAHGFFNLSVDDLMIYQKVGILIDHYELSDVFPNLADGLSSASVSEVRSCYDCSRISDAQVRKVADLAHSMNRFIEKNNLDAIALRCWPEFAATYGISPCAAMSLLAARGKTIACEGDIEGALSLLACRAVSDEAPFFADLSQVNLEEDYALMWHCGVASPTLWDGDSMRSLDTYFADGKGVTADFVLKSGTVTIFRIDSARGVARTFIQKGEAIPMTKRLKGTYAKVKFGKTIREVLRIVTRTGIAHHVAMVYGDHVASFKEFARIMNYEIIE